MSKKEQEDRYGLRIKIHKQSVGSRQREETCESFVVLFGFKKELLVFVVPDEDQCLPKDSDLPV